MNKNTAPIFSPACVANPYPTYRHHLQGPPCGLFEGHRMSLRDGLLERSSNAIAVEIVRSLDARLQPRTGFG